MTTSPAPAPPGRLTVGTKLVFGLGDQTVNLALSAASFFYFVFLTEHGGLGPLLASFVVWVARVIDAFTDPSMGRLSDLTRLRAGRRRPYFLIGAIPLGASFALMWTPSPFDGDLGRFLYYAGAYVALSLSMTCVSVPYLALVPEMAVDYDERTSLNTFRSAGAVLGTLGAVGMKSIVDALEGRTGSELSAWWMAAAITGVWLALPWLAIYRVTFERPEFSRESHLRFLEGARLLLRHDSYRRLSTFYIVGRIAMDLIGVTFLLWFTHWLGRESDFQPTLGLFLIVAVLSLPFWLRIARHYDKRTIFIAGSIWWMAAQLFVLAAQPEWPRWMLFAVAGLAAIGYAVVDLMPWAMLGEVIDEDELATGERREGVYVGFFMFLRKLGGASAVLLVGLSLELVGYDGSLQPGEQSEIARSAIRWLTAIGPVVLLALGVVAARGYRLGREEHRVILDALGRRNGVARR